MSLSKLVAALEGLGLDTAAVIDSIAYIGAAHLGTDLAVVPDDSPASQKKTAAQRAKEYRERKASRVVMHASHDGVTGHDDGVTASHESSHAVTPPTRTRALSSASFSEDLKEKESTGASTSHEANATVTPSVTRPVTRTNAEERVTRHAGGELIAKAEAVRVALTDGFKRHGVIAPAKYLSVPHSTPVIDIARSVEAADLPKLIEGFFAHEDTRKKGYPIAWLAANPAAYMTTTKAAAVDMDTLTLPPTLTEAERRAVSAERAIKRAPVPELCMVKPPPPDVLASAHRKMLEARAS